MATAQQNPIDEALARYDRTRRAEVKAFAEQERAEILKRFPLESWPTMPLEQFALGQPNSKGNTFSWWLEFGAPHLGSIRGGTSEKYPIYKYKNKPGWYFKPEYANELEAWEDIRATFVEMFRLAQAGEWEQIDELLPIQSARVVRVKMLHVYFPSDILPVSSIYHLPGFLHLLGVPETETRNWSIVKLNRTLLAELHKIPQTKGWSTNELSYFLYDWADPRLTHRVVKIAPGESAKYWSDCLSNGYICVGWDEVGDLREYTTEDGFNAKFAEVFGETYNNNVRELTKKAKEVWTLRELVPGDKVVSHKGVSEILGVGEVIEPGYEWNPDRPNLRHIVHVKWDTRFARRIDLPKQWASVTVADVPGELYQRIVKGTGPIDPPVDLLFLQMAEALERKGQLILYGPPGTGKSYDAARFAQWWLSQSTPLAEIKAPTATKRKVATGDVVKRVWWAVANPKEWTWAALFRDGTVEYEYGRLQRNYPLVQPGDWVIGYQSNPDKRILAVARITKGINDIQSDTPRIEMEAVHQIANGLTYAELSSDDILKKSEPIRFNCQGTLFALTQDEADRLFALLSERDPQLSNYLDEPDKSNADVNQLTWITFHPSYSYEDFIEGFRPVDTGGNGLSLKLEDGIFKQICRAAQIHPKRRYLLIVDEINRANLAKVFGEIITLLERDKRSQEIKLPQSKETFLVPPNVYLLGTMNTADRSIRLMDTALRRRFAFIELMPDLQLLRGAKVDDLALDDFLAVLNARLTQAEGREKQIGHSFFLTDGQPIHDAEEFARCFRQEILPLLQEYCYDDFSELATYIGDELVNVPQQTLNQEIIVDTSQLIQALARFVASAE